MFAIAETLARIEANTVFNQRQRKEVASSSYDLPNQVPNPSQELEQSQLGYRGIQNTLTNRDKILRITRKLQLVSFAI